MNNLVVRTIESKIQAEAYSILSGWYVGKMRAQIRTFKYLGPCVYIVSPLNLIYIHNTWIRQHRHTNVGPVCTSTRTYTHLYIQLHACTSPYTYVRTYNYVYVHDSRIPCTILSWTDKYFQLWAGFICPSHTMESESVWLDLWGRTTLWNLRAYG